MTRWARVLPTLDQDHVILISRLLTRLMKTTCWII